MILRLAFVAMILAASAIGDAPSPMDAQVRAAAKVEHDLRARVGFADDSAKAAVRIVEFGGDVRQVSLMAFREGPGRWREERVELLGAGDAYARGTPFGTATDLPPEAGIQLEGLLRDPTLYREPIGAPDSCGKPGEHVVVIQFEGRDHAAVLGGCLPELTGKVARILDTGARVPD